MSSVNLNVWRGGESASAGAHWQTGYIQDHVAGTPHAQDLNNQRKLDAREAVDA